MIYFLLYLFTEVIVTIEIAGWLGSLGTFLEILFSGILGALILVNFQHKLRDTVQNMMGGKISQEDFLTMQLFRVVGAFMLIVPGFFSDAIGLMLQSESLTIIITNLIYKGKKTYVKPQSREMDDVIDVEVIDRNDPK